MIGFHLLWPGGEINVPQAERFIASLRIGNSHEISHCRLDRALLVSAVADSSRPHHWLPARTPSGDAVLFCGHIDNRQHLQRTLRLDPCRENRDASLYAACLAAFGAACDLKVVGQYAAIVWSPGERSVSLTRSPIRAPPLHVWFDKDRLVVASVARALFATGEVPCEVDEQKIADTLFLNTREEERGWYKGATRVPLGAHCHVTAQAATTTRYYDLAHLPRVRFKRDEDYAVAADALFEEATRAALAGFAKPAISLSGGLDSQAVAAYVARVTGGNMPLLGLTGIPEAGWDGIEPKGRLGDERKHAAAIRELYPAIEAETVDAAGLSFDHKLSAMFLMMGAAPRNVMNLHWIHELRGLARRRGCDVVLTGGLGNATLSFDGAGTLPALLRRGRLVRLARELRFSRPRHSSSIHAFISQAVLPLLPDPLWRAQRHWRHGNAEELPIWCGLNPAWAREMGVRERAEHWGVNPGSRLHHDTRASRAAIIGAGGESGDVSLAMEAISGIPKRDPASYRPFVEFCLGIPDDQFLRDGEARRLAKRLLKGKVPDLVLNEKRRGLQAADWHLRLGRDRRRLADELAGLARDPGMRARFDLPRLRQALANWPARTPVEDPRQWQALCLALPRTLATARFIRHVQGQNT